MKPQVCLIDSGLLATSSLFGLSTAICDQQSLPVVDLGYERHQAVSCNESTSLYSFTNIPYAQVPTGDLRFAPPASPTSRNSSVQNGEQGHVCPQPVPLWQEVALLYVQAVLTGQPFNYTEALQQVSNQNSSLADPSPQSEDCLLLDVIVPQAVYERNQNGTSSQNAPVLVWIHGGGYVFGSKNEFGDPSTLIGTDFDPTNSSSEGIVYVALNYRLGAFGFLGGPTFAAQGGVANAGLLDQRFALSWVQQHISKFGGDPSRVTIMGESAGGGSVESQLTAYAGRLQDSTPLFQQAILQSPGIIPVTSNSQQDSIFDAFLAASNAKSVADLRSLSAEQLMDANAQIIRNAPYDDYVFVTTVDKDLMPALPSELLDRGLFAKNISVLSAHNTDEGLLFSDPRIANEDQLSSVLMNQLFPSITQENLDYLLTTVYPPVYDGSMPYTSFQQRYSLLLSEAYLSCNAGYASRAYANSSGSNSFAYKFTVPPAIHGTDLAYTFYDGPTEQQPFASKALQQVIREFVKTGRPGGDTLRGLGVSFPEYSNGSQLLNIGNETLTIERDDTDNSRCDWWGKALFY